MFAPYLYESQGIEIALSSSEIDAVFWNAAAPGAPAEGIEDFLGYLIWLWRQMSLIWHYLVWLLSSGVIKTLIKRAITGIVGIEGVQSMMAVGG